MKNQRTRTAALVLCGLIVLIVVSGISVRRCCNDLISRIDRILAEPAGRTEQIRQLEQAWNDDAGWLRCFVNNQPLADLNAEIFSLRGLCETNPEALSGAAGAVRAELVWIREQDFSVF